MAITDLTGCMWVGNDLSAYGGFGSVQTKNINFTSNGHQYTSIQITDADDVSEIRYGSDMVFKGVAFPGTAGWVNSNYKTIQITGGTDATNSTLIA